MYNENQEIRAAALQAAVTYKPNTMRSLEELIKIFQEYIISGELSWPNR